MSSGAQDTRDTQESRDSQEGRATDPPVGAVRPVARALPALASGPRPIQTLLRYARYGWARIRWGRRLAGLGRKSVIVRPDLVTNPHKIRIGDGVEIRKGARLEARGVADDPSPVLQIGSGTLIHNYFHCGAVEWVQIGDRVLIAGRVYITDHDHDPGVPGEPAVSNRRVRVQPTVIEDDCWLGEGSMVLKGVRVGRGSVVAAGAIVTSDVPPYTIVAGIPARPIRRWSEDDEDWVDCRGR
jgi:lipopolysaccharide O-acetyltransferase